MWFLYTMEYYAVIKKDKLEALTDVGEHNVKWSKSGTQAQMRFILYEEKKKYICANKEQNRREINMR